MAGSKINDIIFCLLLRPNDWGVWIVKEIAEVNSEGRVVSVRSIGHPESVSSISLFDDYKIPLLQGPLLREFAEQMQTEHSGEVKFYMPDGRQVDVSEIFGLFKVR